jgi:putative ABC transport system ATP-binding protein
MRGAKSTEKPLLECRGVWRIYNEGTPAEVRALQDVNLKIGRGEFVAIQGPSGSGKSTLLHAIGCLDTPTRGKIFIGGQDTSKMSQDELAFIRRKKIGFVFQFFNVIPTLTALQNVELPMIFNNTAEAVRKRRAKQLLEKVGLGKRVGHKPRELSGGETQRVAIARAMANDPIIIFADEPTGNLDSKSGKEIIDIFTKLNKEGRTVAVITHDAYVARYAKRKIKIKDGMIIK